MQEDKGKVVARVGEYFLYESDLDRLMRDNMSISDSVIIVDSYINKWAKNKLMLIKAEVNLSEERKNFDRLIEDYRESLITNAYKKELLSQYLDTIIEVSEISKFYEENKNNFLLSNDLVKIKFADFPSSISNKEEIKDLMLSNSYEDMLKLEDLCYKYSYQFGVSDSSWFRLKELRVELPKLREVSDERLLKKENFIEIQDSINLYLTRIIDVRRKREIAPLIYVEDRIKNVILNKRKLDLFKKIEEQIVIDAIKNNEFETYE